MSRRKIEILDQIPFESFYRSITIAPPSTHHMFIERSINFHKLASRAYANDDPDDPCSWLTDARRLVVTEVQADSPATRRVRRVQVRPCRVLIARVINRSRGISIVYLHVSDGAQEEEATEDDYCVCDGQCTFLIEF